MKVSELITALQELPADAEVFYRDRETGRWEEADECYERKIGARPVVIVCIE